MRALTRVATPEREAELLGFARAGSAAKLERMISMWKKLSRDEELTAEEARHRSRAFSVFMDGDGMYVVKGRLEPEVGAVLMRAVEAATNALFRRERDAHDGRDRARSTGDGARSGRRGSGDARPESRPGEAGARSGSTGPRPAPRDTRLDPKQRRADAVGLLAERALAAGFGGRRPRDSGGGSRDSGADSRSGSDAIAGHESRGLNADLGDPSRGASETEAGLGQPAGEVGELAGGLADSSSDSPGEPQAQPCVDSGTRAERYQVVVHCDAATLAAEGDPGRSDLGGIRVSAETSRRMACDAAVVAMVHAKDGSVLNVGRRTRTIPPHIRRALEERDRGCRFPGCAGRFTEAHHVKHWADGGETSLRNTLLLCRRHHRSVHEGRVKVCVNRDGTVLFFTRRGRVLADAPKRPVHVKVPGGWRTDAPRDRGASLPPVSPGTGTALSNGAALYSDSSVPWAVEAAAREAMERTASRPD